MKNNIYLKKFETKAVRNFVLIELNAEIIGSERHKKLSRLHDKLLRLKASQK